MKKNKKDNLDIRWIGCPMICNNDPYNPREGWIPEIKIGLRPDGVVVWENREKMSFTS